MANALFNIPQVEDSKVYNYKVNWINFKNNLTNEEGVNMIKVIGIVGRTQ